MELGAGALFKGGSAPGDVVQGECGTCFFLGAVMALSTRPGMLEQLFCGVDKNAGVYGVRFFKEGDWTYTLIDDRVGVNEDGEQVFSKCKDPKESWLPLLEKAYAMLHG